MNELERMMYLSHESRWLDPDVVPWIEPWPETEGDDDNESK